MTDVPIVMFAFNRPDHLRQVLDALAVQTLRPQRLTIFCDGSRHAGDVAAVEEVVAVASRAAHFYERFELVRRPHNFGCAGNLRTGLAEACDRFERFVVLEDDTVPATHWYAAMALLLEQYAAHPQVAAVGSFPSVCRGSLAGLPDVVLTPRFSCWGWGAWSAKIRPGVTELLTGQFDWDAAALPAHAGHDISPILQGAPPGTLWDVPLAGHFLANGLHQAITSFYLTRNIGTWGISRRQQAFFDRHSRIEDRLPASFATEPDPRVAAAVRAYVDGIST